MAAFGFSIALGGYSCASARSLRREIESAPRDPASGVILGTEAADLGDAEASAACLLLHGFVGSRIDFAGLGDRLSEAGFYVRMVRLPGHGTTPQDFAGKRPEDFIQAVRDEYGALRSRFDVVHVVGFSMGGALATLLASEQDVDRLVLVAPFYRITYFWYYVLPPSIWNALFSPVIRYVPKGERFIKVNRRESLPHMFSYKSVPTRGVKTLVDLGKRARRPEVLREVTCPVLVLHTRGDDAASLGAAEKAFGLLGSRDKTMHIYTERSNHHLLWDYDGEDAAQRIVDFLLELSVDR